MVEGGQAKHRNEVILSFGRVLKDLFSWVQKIVVKGVVFLGY